MRPGAKLLARFGRLPVKLTVALARRAAKPLVIKPVKQTVRAPTKHAQAPRPLG